ncbi:MAG: DUF1566 domain-containing protein [Nitrospira sp. BO4]|jgi:hypothetical protein|nr:DUF1566 domain-containing protein [Nitrospira sp. BO4]
MPTGSCSWDRKIKSAKQRFKILTEFNNEVVLDRETGLVWERRPSKDSMAWSNARLFCAQKAVGGRGGWRLPAFSELASLVDPTVTSNSPRLPAGHPFLDVQPDTYWSATLFADQPGFALAVVFNFVGGGSAPILVTDANTGAGTSGLAWAVRGGSPGPDTY